MAYSHAIFEDTGKSTMPTDEKFVTAGILKYLSQSAICLGAACMTLALPVQARTEKTDHSKVVVKKHVVTKNKSSHDDDEEDAAPKRKASARSSGTTKSRADSGKAKASRSARASDDEEDDGDSVRNLHGKRGTTASKSKDGAKAQDKARSKAAAHSRADQTDEEDASSLPRKGKKGGAHASADRQGKETKSMRTARRSAASDDDEDQATAPATARRLKSTKSRKAERLAEERRQQVAEEARQARMEAAARERQMAEARRAKEAAAAEAARQQQLRERKQAEARRARERALEEDRLATAAAERDSRVRELSANALASDGRSAVRAVPAAQPQGISRMSVPPAAAAATAVLATEAVRTSPRIGNGAEGGSSHPMTVAALPSVNSVVSSDASPAAQQPSSLQSATSRVAFPAAASSTYRVSSRAPASAMGVASAQGSGAVYTPVARYAPPAQSVMRISVPQRDSMGQIRGLSNVPPGAPTDLNSHVAYVMDQNSGQVLLNKNGGLVTPIASISKLMTAVVTMDANLPMDEMITITYDDVDHLKGSSSRLAVGTTLTRQEILHLALMSSENRAAHALGRTYPGGMDAFVRAMNMRAMMLGMRDTHYVEPTGLNSANQSSAHDLALLVQDAYRYPLIRNYTTYPAADFPVNGRIVHFHNTNRLVHDVNWNIGLQKTGYISEAGRCVVMQSNIAGRNVIIVLLDSGASSKRVEDAEAIRSWVENGQQGRGAYPATVRVIAQQGRPDRNGWRISAS